jgi:hypothetical protein
VGDGVGDVAGDTGAGSTPGAGADVVGAGTGKTGVAVGDGVGGTGVTTVGPGAGTGVTVGVGVVRTVGLTGLGTTGVGVSAPADDAPGMVIARASRDTATASLARHTLLRRPWRSGFLIQTPVSTPEPCQREITSYQRQASIGQRLTALG